MAEPFAVPNEVQGVLGTEFVLGTDTSIKLAAIGLFDTGGGHVRVQTTDGAHWALVTYTGGSTNDLTGATQVGLSGQLYSTGDGTYTFPVGSYVYRVCMGEDVSKRIMGPASATDGDFFQADGTTGKKAKVGLSFKDEDDMASNSATAVPSQQSLKAYADALAKIGCGRLTLTTATPITAADVTAATTLYFTPYRGDKIALYTGSVWQIKTFTELSIKLTDVQSCVVANGDATVTTPANGTRGLVVGQEVTGAHVPGATTVLSVTDSTHFEMSANATGDATEDLTFKLPASKQYDVFMWNDAGTLRLEWGPVWTNATTRATDIAFQDGVYVKSGVTTRLYLGTICTTTTAGQTEDSLLNRLVWNFYNREWRKLFKEDANIHTYATASWRAWNNDSTFKFGLVQGLTQPLFLSFAAQLKGDADGRYAEAAFGADGSAENPTVLNANVQYSQPGVSQFRITTLGYHYFLGMENASTADQCAFKAMLIYGAVLG